MIKIFLVLSTLMISSAFGQAKSHKSIQWQQINLEKELKNHYENFLALYLDQDSYFVHLKIKTKEQNFTLPTHNIKFKKNSSKFIKNNKPRDLNSDLIALDKIGLFAPKYNSSDNKEVELKLFQYKNKIERDFFKKTNLFEFIENITVYVAVSNDVPESKMKSLDEILKKITPELGSLKFNLSMYQIEFKQNKKVHLSPLDRLMEKISDLGNSLGIILATLIFSLTLIFLFSRYRSLQENTLATAIDEGQNLDEQPQPSLDEPTLRPGSEQLAQAVTELHNGLDRFIMYLERSPQQAVYLVRKWINLGTTSSQNALVLLSEKLTIEELAKIFSQLTIDERDYYGKITDRLINNSDMVSAEKYISQQIIEDLLYVAVEMEDGLQKLLIELSPQKAADIAVKQMDLGAILINVMSTDFISEMFKYVDADVLEELTIMGLGFKPTNFQTYVGKLKQCLLEVKAQNEKNSFERKILELLKDLDMTKENRLINALVKRNQFDALYEFSMMTLPSELVFDIPDEILKEALYKFTLTQKVEILASLDNDLRESVLDKISEQGTQGREVLEHEIKTTLENEVQLTKIELNKEKYLSIVVAQVREYIVLNESENKAIVQLVENWIDSKRSVAASAPTSIAA